jgi:hypothetical protein
MKKPLTKHDMVYDGFVHRNFDENLDGWRNELPDPSQYPSLQMAQDILNMFDELCAAREQIWRLEKQLKLRDGSQGIDSTSVFERMMENLKDKT